MEKKHVYYFDYLRLISALGVIYMHVAADPLRGTLNTDWHGMNVVTSLAFTAVPLFLMMSGYLILTGEKTLDVNVLLKKRLPRLVVPLIGWTIVAVVWRLVFVEGISAAGFYNGMVAAIRSPAWVHFWYLYTLIALYLLSPVLYGGLNSLDRTGKRYVFVLICILNVRTMLSAVLPDWFRPFTEVHVLDLLSFMSGSVAIFILGYYLGRLEKRIPNGLLLLTAILTAGIIIVGTYRRTVISGAFDQTFQNQFSGFEIVLASCLFLLFKQNVNRESRFFKLVPVLPLALSIYLMHNILLALMQMKIRVDTFWETIWVTGLNFILCFLTMKTVASIKPICWLFTGIPYQSACESCNWIYTCKKIRSSMKRSKP